MMRRESLYLWYLSRSIPYTAEPTMPPKINPAPIKGETSFTLNAYAIMSTAVPSALKTPSVSPNMHTNKTYDQFRNILLIAFLNGSLCTFALEQGSVGGFLQKNTIVIPIRTVAITA